MKAGLDLALTFIASLVFCLRTDSGSAAAYDLHSVKGIEAFDGSKEAREILARNGFVVSDPAFKQAGRYAQRYDPKAGFWEGFTSIPWSLASVPGFALRGSLPHRCRVRASSAVMKSGVMPVPRKPMPRCGERSLRITTGVPQSLAMTSCVSLTRIRNQANLWETGMRWQRKSP